MFTLTTYSVLERSAPDVPLSLNNTIFDILHFPKTPYLHLLMSRHGIEPLMPVLLSQYTPEKLSFVQVMLKFDDPDGRLKSHERIDRIKDTVLIDDDTMTSSLREIVIEDIRLSKPKSNPIYTRHQQQKIAFTTEIIENLMRLPQYKHLNAFAFTHTIPNDESTYIKSIIVTNPACIHGISHITDPTQDVRLDSRYLDPAA